jgi:maltodextrin utilization protein YvdJ
MDVNVDVGKNIATLLENLAQQIGTTVDKVYPWYVQQAQLEGVTFLIAVAVFIFVVGMAFVIFITAAIRKESEPAQIASFLSGMLLIFGVVAVGIDGPDAVRKLLNPNYYAMKMITQDIGRLVAK